MGLLLSKLFRNDVRLEDCAVKDSAHILPGSVGDFVSKIQKALFAIDKASIAANELDVSRYGPSTAAAVLKYKQNHNPPIINFTYQAQADNVIGKMTIVFLDREMMAIENLPIPPSVPPQNELLSLVAAKQKIRSYLAREAKRNVADILIKHPASLLVFGETHFVADPMKAFLFSELIVGTRLRRPTLTNFHASERFMNDQSTRNRISSVLQANPPERMKQPISRLTDDLRPFVPVLASANSFPARRYGILPCGTIAGGSDPGNVSKHEDIRHNAIFNAFVDASNQCPDVPVRSINSAISRGNILLGARHAALRSVGGRAIDTTCGLLVKAGWNVLAIQMTGPFTTGETVVPQDFKLRLLNSKDDRVIDSLAIIEEVAGGRSFFADLTKPDSPFSKVKDMDSGAAEIPFNELFHAIVHVC